ncbi:hypothetical protein [Desulfothermus naphthae]|nr:hypothetical protein [Candidatus Desulfofervidus auxilii]
MARFKSFIAKEKYSLAAFFLLICGYLGAYQHIMWAKVIVMIFIYTILFAPVLLLFLLLICGLFGLVPRIPETKSIHIDRRPDGHT